MRARSVRGLHSLCLLLALASGVSAQDAENLLRRGISLVNASRPLEAEAVLQSVLEKDAQQVEARILLGFLFLQRAALPEAAQAFGKALELDPSSAPARLGLGVTLARKGLPQKAAGEFEKILAHPSLGTKANANWIHSLFMMGKTEEASRRAQDLAARFPSVPEYQSTLGSLCQARGKTQEAIQAYLRAVQLAPRSLPNLLSLVELYRNQRDWENAARWAERALELDPDHPLLFHELAVAYEHLGRPQEAADAQSDAERSYQAEVLHTQAMKASAGGRGEDAKDLLRHAARVNPRSAKVWVELGERLRREGDTAEAQDCYRMALEANPDNVRAYLGLAALLQSEGRDEEAIAWYRNALERGLASPDLRIGIAASYLHQSKATEAAAQMLRAVRELPDEPDLLAYLGYMNQSSGKDQEALDAYSVALTINPNHVDARVGKARALLNQGEIEQAVEQFRQACKLDPRQSAAWRGLILAQRRAGNSAAAESACRACLARIPADIECREQLASLRMEAADYQESAQLFQTLLRNGYATKSILDGLAFSMMRNGDYEQAVGLFLSSLKRFGPDAWVYGNLGYLSRIQGNLSDSVAYYRKARDLVPNDAQKCHDLGYALYLVRDFASAVEAIQAALRLKPTWGLAHHNLALTYWHLGQLGLALAHARSAQERGAPEADPVVKALSLHLSPNLPKTISVYIRRR